MKLAKASTIKWAFALLLACALMLPAMAASAQEEWKDGSYTVDYLVLKAEDDSVSIANDYWEKPASVVFNKGKTTIRLTINHSDWVTEFKVSRNGSYSDAQVIETNNSDNRRVVQFTTDDVTKPILSKIHVAIPDIGYDHGYTIRLVFDTDSFKLVKAAEPERVTEPSTHPSEKPAANKPAATAKPSAQPTDKPKTSVKDNGKDASGPSEQQSAAAKETPAADGNAKATEGKAEKEKASEGTSGADTATASSASPAPEATEAPAEETAANANGGAQANGTNDAENAEGASEDNAPADSEAAVENVAASTDDAVKAANATAGTETGAASAGSNSARSVWAFAGLVVFVGAGASFVWIRRKR
ncbi:heme uptake protein IsdC [Paenibacillus sp. NPDC058071]|uniref:heme uptake protein IsdC n=1 Tax=Paenibacillus sp. NPDC058071 TaxID=3346326 RepID=UPI0036DF8585